MTRVEARERFAELKKELKLVESEFERELEEAKQGLRTPFSSEEFYERHKHPNEILREMFTVARIIEHGNAPN